jgi:hypothetical protein
MPESLSSAGASGFYLGRGGREGQNRVNFGYTCVN